MHDLLCDISEGVNINELKLGRVESDLVETCINKLKCGKGDGGNGFDSDNLINYNSTLSYMISLLYNTMLTHGHYANDLLHSSIISIPKDPRSSLGSSDNYRGISLCCSICKLFDHIILHKYGDILSRNDLQFGFKDKHSTSMCTAVYKESIHYFTMRNSNVYSCLLDARKAFDKVHYGKLFRILFYPPDVDSSVAFRNKTDSLC